MAFSCTDKTGKQLSWEEALHKLIKRIQNYKLEFVTGVLWWCVGYLPFHSVRVWLYKLSGMKIGKGSTIHMMGRFFDPSGISIGKDTIIGEQVILDGRALLKIGNHVDIASRVMVWNSEHDIHSKDFHAVDGPVTIEDYVFIGPNSIILPGVTIGKGAVVAAGAVVVKNIEPFSIVGGIPAKVIGQRKAEAIGYVLGRARLFQ